MDKYLDLLELPEPAYTDEAVAPLSMIKPEEWTKYFSARQLDRVLKLKHQTMQRLLNRHQSFARMNYEHVEGLPQWPWRIAYQQRGILQNYQTERNAFENPSNISHIRHEIDEMNSFNQLLDAIQNDISSIQTQD